MFTSLYFAHRPRLLPSRSETTPHENHLYKNGFRIYGMGSQILCVVNGATSHEQCSYKVGINLHQDYGDDIDMVTT